MKVIVTGAAGFVGAHLCTRLVNDGHEVYGIDVSSAAGERLKHDGVHPVQADLCTDTIPDEWFDGCGVLVHTAGILGPQGLPYRTFHRVNVEATKRIVTAALKRNVQKIIHFSSVGVLGTGPAEPVGEEAPPAPIDAYDKTKLEAELWIRDLGKSTDGIAVVRPAWVYGPGDRRTLKLFRALQKGRFFFVGGGKGLQHPVYIDDLVDGLLLLAHETVDSGSVFHLGGPEIITIRELVETACAMLDVPVPRINMPYIPMRIAGKLCETVAGLLHIDPPLSVAKVDFFVKNRAYSIDKARKLIGYEPKTTFHRGLEHTIAWYKKEKWL